MSSAMSDTPALKRMRRFIAARKPGWFYRRWDVAHCKVQIRGADERCLPNLEAALANESKMRKPRKRLLAALKKKISELNSSKEAQ